LAEKKVNKGDEKFMKKTGRNSLKIIHPIIILGEMKRLFIIHTGVIL
jgi:hypothetical protein